MEDAPAPLFEKNKNPNYIDFKEYKIDYNKSSFDILIGLIKEGVIIKSLTYNTKISQNDLSKLTNVIYNSTEELYEFIKNIFEQKKAIIKEVTKEKMILIIIIYDALKMKEKEIEINLICQIYTEDDISRLIDRCFELEKEIKIIKDNNKEIIKKYEKIEEENKKLKEENIQINNDISILKDKISIIFGSLDKINNQMMNNNQINKNNFLVNNNIIPNNNQINKDNNLMNFNQKIIDKNIPNNNQDNINHIKNINHMENNNNTQNYNQIKNNIPIYKNQIITPTQDTPGNNFDVIILGTGLKESILACLLTKYPKEEKAPWESGAKILQLDRNNYYGSDSASLNLKELWKYFRNKKEHPKQYGKNIEWNVDLIPKLIMANGSLVKILLKTNVSKYLEWKNIDRTFVFQFDKGGMFSKGKGKIIKIPNSASEALKCDLMGLLEKNRIKKFLQFVMGYDKNNWNTQKGLGPQSKFKDIIKQFGLEPFTVDLIGHVVSLYTNEDFLEKESIKSIDKIKLYCNSFGLYGKSPFIYPIWGLSQLSEAFSRFCSLYGGTYILNRDIEDILYDQDGNFRGIKSQGEEIYGKILITEPSYIKTWNMVKSIGKIFRRICVLDHPIRKTEDVHSCQIIIPSTQINRKNDIIIHVFNWSYLVCKRGYYLAIISTIVERSNPSDEIQPAMDIISPVLETFDKVSEIYSPIDKSYRGNIYITSSYDQQSHFENDIDDAIDIYEKITGLKLDL